MTTKHSGRRTTKVAVGSLLGLGLVAGLAGPAAAQNPNPWPDDAPANERVHATSKASAWAAEGNLKLAGQNALNIPLAVTKVTNDGTQPTQTGGSNKAPDGIAQFLQIGVLGQNATAWNDGTSAACAGLAGSGGQIAVGKGGCENNQDESAAHLGIPGLIDLKAQVLTAECSADASTVEKVRGSVRFAGVQLRLGPAIGGFDVNIPLDPEPNFGPAVDLGPLANATVQLNRQERGDDGSLTVTALSVELNILPVIGNQPIAGARIDIGKVTCGGNTEARWIPAVPAEALPLAAGVGAAAIGAYMWNDRRRKNATGSI